MLNTMTPSKGRKNKYLTILLQKCGLSRILLDGPVAIPRFKSYLKIKTYLLDGNTRDFKLVKENGTELITTSSLDRENPPKILYVIIEASNEQKPSGDCTVIDCTSTSVLNNTIEVNNNYCFFFNLLSLPFLL